MGANDHIPNAQQKSKSRRRGKSPKEVLDWSMADSLALTTLIGNVSAEGGYIGFGRNADADCLLLYIKCDDWKERIAIETRDDILPTLTELSSEF